MHSFFSILLLSFLFTGSVQALPSYPIPDKVQDFYADLNGQDTTNCVRTRLHDDLVFGPQLGFYFEAKDGSEQASADEIIFSDLNLYGQNFKTTYNIVQAGVFEALTVVKYVDACVPEYPFGSGCRPNGIRRIVFQMTKDITNGKIIEANYQTASRSENLFGKLKKNWESKWFYQYQCKNGVLTMKLGID